MRRRVLIEHLLLSRFRLEHLASSTYRFPEADECGALADILRAGYTPLSGAELRVAQRAL